MKDLHLLTWLTQLGLGTAVPVAGFVLLAVWLKNRFGWGNWVLFAGVGLGLLCGVNTFYRNIKALSGTHGKTEEKKPPVSYTEHD